VLGYLRARGAADPEDLAAEVFLQVVRGLPAFHGDERDFRAWVLTIAHRRLVDDLRRRRRRPVDVASDETIAARGPIGDVEQEALDRLGVERVRWLIGLLSDDQQSVLLLRIVGDFTTGEVARVLGKRAGAVKALQRRALARIRRELEREEPPRA
jgi:RNA polymerase sigma factor (sigma-70 family)